MTIRKSIVLSAQESSMSSWVDVGIPISLCLPDGLSLRNSALGWWAPIGLIHDHRESGGFRRMDKQIWRKASTNYGLATFPYISTIPHTVWQKSIPQKSYTRGWLDWVVAWQSMKTIVIQVKGQNETVETCIVSRSGKHRDFLSIPSCSIQWPRPFGTTNRCLAMARPLSHQQFTAWWYTYPSEKYESQLGLWNSQYMEQ